MKNSARARQISAHKRRLDDLSRYNNFVNENEKKGHKDLDHFKKKINILTKELEHINSKLR
jgi:hypothetical protein